MDSGQQDRIDLLRGRLARLDEQYKDERVALFARLRWVDESKEGKSGVPKLTMRLYESDIAPTLAPSLEKLQTALHAWLTTRDELAALEGKGR